MQARRLLWLMAAIWCAVAPSALADGAGAHSPDARARAGAGLGASTAAEQDFLPSLRLIGTVTGDPSVACAVIDSDEPGGQRIFRVGELVQGALVERIERTRVVLSYQGRMHELSLGFRPALRAPEAKRRAIEPHGPAVPPGRTVYRKPSGPEAACDLVIADRMYFHQRVQALRQALQACAEPHYGPHGRLLGLRIAEWWPLEAADRAETESMRGVPNAAHLADLSVGDVIIAINGEPVAGQAQAVASLEKAAAKGAVNLTMLKPDGRELTVSYRPG